MDKVQFIKYMNNIKSFRSQQAELDKAIYSITDGFSVVTIGDILIKDIIELIETDLGYKDMLEWWLYENVEKLIYDKDNNIKADVTNLEDLYDYMVNNKY